MSRTLAELAACGSAARARHPRRRRLARSCCGIRPATRMTAAWPSTTPAGGGSPPRHGPCAGAGRAGRRADLVPSAHQHLRRVALGGGAPAAVDRRRASPSTPATSGWPALTPGSTSARFGDRVNHVHLKDVRRTVLERAKAEGRTDFDDLVGRRVHAARRRRCRPRRASSRRLRPPGLRRLARDRAGPSAARRMTPSSPWPRSRPQNRRWVEDALARIGASASAGNGGATMTEVRVFPDDAALGAALADEIAGRNRRGPRSGRRYVLGCPGGRSARSTYQALAPTRVAGADLGHLVIAMMDDYIVRGPSGGLEHVPGDAHYSCRRFAHRRDRGTARTRPPPWAWRPTTSGCPIRRSGRLPSAASKTPGGVDLFIVASGASDGHVAFVKPGTPLDGDVSIIPLAETTRRDNTGHLPGLRLARRGADPRGLRGPGHHHAPVAACHDWSSMETASGTAAARCWRRRTSTPTGPRRSSIAAARRRSGSMRRLSGRRGQENGPARRPGRRVRRRFT